MQVGTIRYWDSNVDNVSTDSDQRPPVSQEHDVSDSRSVIGHFD